ncbi:MAG: acyl-CoA dehydrogenase, partial [Burkholderiales bacterium]
KLGYRGIPNTLLNFGEGKFPVRGSSGGGLDGAGSGAVGYRVGKPGEGLRCMFHMMNEARIAIGLGATMLGYAGYEASLQYARERAQGRLMQKAALGGAGGPAGKDVAKPPVRIIEHADVKRMLLAQKAYVEGGLALCLYCAQLVDEQHTGSGEAARQAALLLEVLTPIVKSWPSEWCLEANSLAIQVHGGYGYTRDFAVEQYWRDNRLNMIHEGTHGIQAQDLLGRKVVMDDGAGLKLLGARIQTSVERALQNKSLAPHAQALAAALQAVAAATRAAWSGADPDDALTNAMPYMRAFGHMVIAWIWLELGLAADGARGAAEARAGRLQAMRYFYAYELPQVTAWLAVVNARDPVCREMRDEWF